MLCLVFSGAFCFVRGEAGLGEKKGIPIEIKDSTGSVSGSDRGNSINPSIDGHVLTVVFTENLGHVTVEVTTADNGAVVETTGLYTPNGACLYIPDAGSYVVTFTLPDGDEYYGEFEVVGDPYVADSCLILNSEQLNFHYHGELELIQNRLYQGNAYAPLVPFRAEIEACQAMDNGRDYIRIWHHTQAWYGFRTLCQPGVHERESLEP